MLIVFWDSLKTQIACGGNLPTDCIDVFGGSKNTVASGGSIPPDCRCVFGESEKAPEGQGVTRHKNSTNQSNVSFR